MSLTDWPEAQPDFLDSLGAAYAEVYSPSLEELTLRWAEAEPLIRKGTERTGCFEPVDLLVLAIAGKLSIWFCQAADILDAVVVTEIKQFPRRRICEVLFAGGGNLKAWITPLVAVIDKHARAAGCDHIASIGRPGWVRAWGAEATGDIVMVRELKNV